MNTRIYEKTRYQNIYRNIKNKNYVVMMSTPIKTSIARIDGKKIMDTDTAIKVRDNIVLKTQKANEALHKESFDTLWDKYIDNCKTIKKLAYNSINRKQKLYNKYLKSKSNKPLSKTDKNYWAHFIDDCDCSNKQKNHMLKELKAFGNWCVEEKYLLNNPISGIPNYKVTKTEMKYWLPNEIKTFFEILENDINSNNKLLKTKAHIVKVFTMIGFCLGNRVGETRALSFGNVNEDKKTITISHSIDYDPKSKTGLSHTKNYHSQRVIDVTDKLIIAINEYKKFLINELGCKVEDNTLILYNFKNMKPYSDTALREKFNYYCDKAKVTRIRMYDLRHTYVATMMGEGIELYKISERIGHSNFSTTVNKYGHLSSEARKEVAKTTDKYL